MTSALHSPSVYQEIVTHATLNLMTKLTDYAEFYGTAVTAKEQDKALQRAWISNTEIKILEAKAKNKKN